MSDVQSVTIPNSRYVEFTSKVNGRRYAISLGLPLDPPPEKGYCVLYVLDGYAYFASATEAVRVNGNAPATVVVGIGYPDDPEFAQSVLETMDVLPPPFDLLPPHWAAVTLGRMYDLSLPASAEVLAEGPFKTMKPESFGGLDDFLKMIEVDVKPRVAGIVRIDQGDQAIFGHSLGGLAVLHALFSAPNAYRTFIAASPSIWWSDLAVLKGEAKFAAAVESGAAKPRVLITTGAEEDLPALKQAKTPDEVARARKYSMLDNVTALTARLQALHGSGPFEVSDCAIFDRQGHGISPWPAIGRAIAFAFPRLA